MTTQPNRLPAAAQTNPLSVATTLLLAFACGATTANVYYAQSIVGPIAAGLQLPASLAGLIVTTTQVGYGIGLFFLVCVADLVENRKLVLIAATGTILSLIGVACSTSAPALLITSLALGICTVGSQILVPLAVQLSPEAQRGRVIGNIMCGLVAGIMLSRPLASFLTAYWGWRSVFIFSAVVMFCTLLLLARSLPEWRPRPSRGYAATLRSMLCLLATSRPLQRRAAYQGTMFAVFNMFWTAGPLMLHVRFDMGQVGISAFALAGAAGALSAPLAGKIADRGGSRLGTGLALLCAALAMLISEWGEAVGSLLILVAAAIILDAATQANQVFGLRTIQSLDAEARGRLNAAYMTVIFLCGAMGSALGSMTYYYGGWLTTSLTGAALVLFILGIFTTEVRAPRKP
ncbi:MFS transporter [Gibbsiella quercinecans]|uniref:MFS transporter n=1 Tax=Gibbsiella quercinecans TaxID=929813 RepID=UPI003A4E41BA